MLFACYKHVIRMLCPCVFHVGRTWVPCEAPPNCYIHAMWADPEVLKIVTLTAPEMSLSL